MLPRFIRIREILTHNLWLSPLCFAIGGAAMAVLAIHLPAQWNDSLPGFWPRFGSGNTVRSFTSTLLATLVTMTTFALSVTMVVLTLAAGSLGPRTIRNFMGDRKTQNALGCFVGSILFLITSYMLMGGDDGGTGNGGSGADASMAAIPQIAASVGVGLFVICLFVLIVFVHHLGRSIVADQVIDKVGRNLQATITGACTTLSTPMARARKHAITLPDVADIDAQAALHAPASGYIQGIDYDGLCDGARKAGLHVTLIVHAGQHLLRGEVIGAISPMDDDGPPAPRLSANPANGKATAANPPMATGTGTGTGTPPMPTGNPQDITRHILIGDQRTAALDIEFALRQLVEMALRALSPGINDPFTAIAAIYRLGRVLPHAMAFDYPAGIWCDDRGNARLHGLLADFDGMLGAAFNQIRQSASAKPDVLIPILQVLEKLLGMTGNPDQRKLICDHARIIEQAAKRDIPDTHDRDAVLRAANAVLR